MLWDTSHGRTAYPSPPSWLDPNSVWHMSEDADVLAEMERRLTCRRPDERNGDADAIDGFQLFQGQVVEMGLFEKMLLASITMVDVQKVRKAS